MGYSSKRVANFEAIREYFQQGDTPKMIENRKKVYATEKPGVPLDTIAAAEICSFFHFWGMMVTKGYLPLWIFKSASGYSVIKMYYLLKPFIEERRKDSNEHYAEGFELLVRRIKKKYKYQYVVEQREDDEFVNQGKVV